ncbi:MAG: hypothetical protein PHN60_02505 [Candidatus Gracilibacteria bacterium]|nr:hypothetical protein [Candidatus Gracilibacteria bacterium]
MVFTIIFAIFIPVFPSLLYLYAIRDENFRKNNKERANMAGIMVILTVLFSGGHTMILHLEPNLSVFLLYLLSLSFLVWQAIKYGMRVQKSIGTMV